MAGMMDKAKNFKMEGAYGGFTKPNPAKLTPASSKLAVLNKAADESKKEQL